VNNSTRLPMKPAVQGEGVRAGGGTRVLAEHGR
jgi:ribosomal protein S5